MAWTLVGEAPNTNTAPANTGKWSLVGEAKPAKKPETSIGQDVMQGFADIPGAAFEGLTSLPGQVYGAADQILTDPMRALANAAAGLVETGKGINNLPSNTMQYLGKKGLVSNKAANSLNFSRSNINNVNIPQAMGVSGAPQKGDALIQSLGYAPFGAAGELGALGALGRAGARAGAAGAYGAAQGQNPITAAGLGPVTEGMIRAPIGAAKQVSNTVNKFTPTQQLSGKLTNAELMDNLRSAQGTSTPLGNVVQSPYLNKLFNNTISNTPFSGADALHAKIANETKKSGQDVIDHLEPGYTSKRDENAIVKDLLMSSKKHATEKKNEYYNRMNDRASYESFNPDLKQLKATARTKKQLLKDDPLIDSIPRLKGMLNFDDIRKGASNKKKPLSLNDAIQHKSYLYTQAKNLGSSPDAYQRAKAKNFGDLAKSLDMDINRSLQDKGSPLLQRFHKTANENYQKDYLDYLDKNNKDLFNPDKKSDSIARKIIRPSQKSDDYTSIAQVKSMLPEHKRDALAYAYLKSAVDRKGKLDTKKLGSRLQELGPRQFNTLFHDSVTKDKVNKFLGLHGMNQESLNIMANPKTGNRNKYLSYLLAATAPAARYGAKKLTNEEYRNKLVKKIMENQTNQANKPMMDMTLNKFSGYQNALNQAAVPFSINNQGGNQ